MENINLVSPQEAHYTVYKLTDPEGKVYIGCTGMKVEYRWNKGKQYWRTIPIGKAIDRFGWENFNKEILCERLTKAGAEKLEKWFIEYYDSMNPEKGYNCITGGCRKGAHKSEQSKARNRISTLACYSRNPDIWRMYSVRIKAFYREHPERKAEIAAQISRYLLSAEGRKFAESSSKPKPVRCVETGEVFPSQRAAEKATGFLGIHKACSGLQSVAGGYHWEYCVL